MVANADKNRATVAITSAEKNRVAMVLTSEQKNQYQQLDIKTALKE